MKIIVLILVLCTSLNVVAQDTLIFRTGDEIPVKVLEIGILEIKYIKWDNQDGPMYVHPKAEVFAIKFSNGKYELFQEQQRPKPNSHINYNPQVDQLEGMSQDEKYLKGRMDAKKFYKGNGTLWGTGAATFLFPPLGVIVGTATALSPPKEINYNAPEPQLLKDNQYHLGYKRQAQSKKAGKALTGFGLGIGSLIILSLIIPQ